MKHTMESDIRVLEAEGYGILSCTRTRNGHAILWFGDRGCTVTVRKPKSISVGNILPFEIAKAKYMQEIQELIQPGGNAMSESTDKGWTPIEIYKSAWASTRLQEPWAVEMVYPDFPPKKYPELRVLTLSEVLSRAVERGWGPSEHQVNLPQQVAEWMTGLGLASLYTLEKATLSLSQSQRLDMLAGWFNRGDGLPSPSTRPGDKYKNTRIGLYLGHPSLLNQFLRWLIRYLGAHETVDGRVDHDCGRVINLARELQDKLPVRRY